MRQFLSTILLLLTTITGCNVNGDLTNMKVVHHDRSLLSVTNPNYQTAFSATYNSGEVTPDELKDVQCPIPHDCRVQNYTRTQCVFSSLECLARWAECKQLLEPDVLTSRPGCRSYSGPADAASKLKKFGVKFEDSYGNRIKGIELLKKAMADGRGALFGVPGHAMVICHYDEEKNVAKIIDNSDKSLRVQTWTAEQFRKRWDSWIIVIYADNDLFPAKARGGDLANQIPIVDGANPSLILPKGSIPLPQKD